MFNKASTVTRFSLLQVSRTVPAMRVGILNKCRLVQRETAGGSLGVTKHEQ